MSEGIEFPELTLIKKKTGMIEFWKFSCEQCFLISGYICYAMCHTIIYILQV